MRGARLGQIDRPVEPDARCPEVDQVGQRVAGVAREDNGRHATRKPVKHGAHGAERETAEFRRRQHAAPGVEQHDGVGAGCDLLAQIGDNGIGIEGDEPREQIRTRIGHSPHARKVGAAAAFDHVARERERAARESDQRHAACKRALDFGDGVEHVAQAREIRNGEFRDGLLVAGGVREARSLAFGEREPEPHRVRHRQDVGEENRGVEVEPGKRLQRHLGGQRRRGGQRHEASRACP